MQILVVVPTYNEATTIRAVVDAVTDLGFEILVVDDGSPDGTADLVSAMAVRHGGIHLLRRTSKEGLGSAYRAGFDWALRAGRYDAVAQMDADLSHDPLDLKRLVDTLVEDGADLVIGSRYVAGGSTVGWARRRQWLSRAGNHYMRLMTGIPLRDLTAGFRVWRTRTLADLALTETVSEGYSFQLETVTRAAAAGTRVVEVPIVFTERAEGESKMTGSIAFEALWRVALWGWRLRRSR
ncbi:polyprenol monophosphomannose synthase [Egicoccus sp. AB-alg6-2]|uniref:polyprenol monophosphomannose synthase n=1 Tax=Egicoccus sp. AB-alg6-2 TaxID=3242692 RepID=UPI00359DB6A2